MEARSISCSQRTPGPCNYGDSSLCVPPSVVVECASELPCDGALPQVEWFWPPLGSLGSIEIKWNGLVSTDVIEVLLTEKYQNVEDDPLVPVYGIEEIVTFQDEDAPAVVTKQVGSGLTNLMVYSVFIRRIRNGKVSAWNYDTTIALTAEVLVITDSVTGFALTDDDGETLLLDD